MNANYTYAPYGQAILSGSSDKNSHTYAGREDDGSGALFNRARYYEPATGRFLSPDPLRLEGGTNPYAYANGNPISSTDPWGTFAFVIPIALESLELLDLLLAGGAAIDLALLNKANTPTDEWFDLNGAKAPGHPGGNSDIPFCDPKGGPKLVKAPNGRGKGFLDGLTGGVFVPTEWGPDAHGGPHWDVQRPDGSHDNARL